MFLQQRYSSLVGIGGVVVSAHTFLEGEGLVEPREHIGVLFLCVVVVDDASFPVGCHCFDAQELIRFFAFIGEYRQLVAAYVAFGGEVFEHFFLHEVGLHIEFDGDAGVSCPFEEVVAPSHHFGDGGLSYEGAELPEVGASFPPEFGCFIVVFYGRLPGGVDIEYEFVKLAPFGSGGPFYPVLSEYGAFGDRVVHILFLEGAVSLEAFYGLYFFACPFSCPCYIAVFVVDIDA